MIMKNIAEMTVEDLAKHIEEFASAFIKKTNADPRKIVMIHTTRITGQSIENIYWFEKKRGRSRKEIINNLTI